MPAEPSVRDLGRILRAFLARQSTLGLATAGPDGEPHAANVNFVADESLDLFFLSSPSTVHARHIAQRAEVAATCHAPFDSPAGIRGVQLHGACEPCAFDEPWRRFVAKFPYAAAVSRRDERFFVLRPRWVRWIDNSIRFGFKLESGWPPPTES